MGDHALSTILKLDPPKDPAEVRMVAIRLADALELIAAESTTTTSCRFCRGRGDVQAALVSTDGGNGPAHETWCPRAIARAALKQDA